MLHNIIAHQDVCTGACVNVEHLKINKPCIVCCIDVDNAPTSQHNQL